tara:strand:+ start:1245 stop:1430 length:186 start_codon:yes stop_codon:yes gene_type:complete
MKKAEIQELINIRQDLVGYYSRLDGQSAPGTAVTLQRDVANVVELTVKRLDQLLSEYVNFS